MNASESERILMETIEEGLSGIPELQVRPELREQIAIECRALLSRWMRTSEPGSTGESLGLTARILQEFVLLRAEVALTDHRLRKLEEQRDA